MQRIPHNPTWERDRGLHSPTCPIFGSCPMPQPRNSFRPAECMEQRCDGSRFEQHQCHVMLFVSLWMKEPHHIVQPGARIRATAPALRCATVIHRHNPSHLFPPFVHPPKVLFLPRNSKSCSTFYVVRAIFCLLPFSFALWCTNTTPPPLSSFSGSSSSSVPPISDLLFFIMSPYSSISCFS